jgi:thiamine biosynthesis lipoprotein
MGTVVTVTAVAEAGVAREAVDAAFAAMTALAAKMSRFNPESDVSRLNQTAGQGAVTVSPEVWDVLCLSMEVSHKTDGAFDMSVGPLVALWKKSGSQGKLPPEAELASACARVGWERIRLHAQRSVSLAEGMRLDLGGLAKGFIVDRGVDILKARGVTAGMVEAGGDICAFGSRPGGGAWRLGVQDPRRPDDPAVVAVLNVTDRGVTTSGHYRRFSMIEGRRFSHILDPRTGRPVENRLLSVTVVAPTAALADGLSTALSVLGKEKGLSLVESLAGVECLLLEEDETRVLRQVASSGMGAYLVE